MGDDTTITANASPTRQMRRATQLFVHPQYDAETFENDIAVIRVRRPFNQTGSFAPMRRAFTRPGDNTTCRVGMFRSEVCMVKWFTISLSTQSALKIITEIISYTATLI